MTTVRDYGDEFVDVYDDWYGGRDDPSDVVATVRALLASSRRPAGTRARVLELGVGTGRLALPLVASGLDVVGVDNSPAMLRRLRDKVPAQGAERGAGTLRVALGDVTDAEVVPPGPHDVVLLAYNMVCNLLTEADQRRCLRLASTLRAPRGAVVVEAFVPAPVASIRVERVTRPDGRVVRIETDLDPTRQLVSGVHVEEAGPEAGRRREWRIRYVTPPQLDGFAAACGLCLVEEWEDWSRGPFWPGSSNRLAVYR